MPPEGRAFASPLLTSHSRAILESLPAPSRFELSGLGIPRQLWAILTPVRSRRGRARPARSREWNGAPIPGRTGPRPVPRASAVTREERNVLLFVAFGVLLGSLPELGGEGEPERDGRDVSLATKDVVATSLFPIDVNDAGPELLCELPGIGPVKARAIVDRREEHGPFRRIDELAEVRGIGPRTVAKLRDLVTLGEGSRGDASAEREANAAPRGRLVAGTSRKLAPGAPADHAGAAGGRPDAAEVLGRDIGSEPHEDGGAQRE